MAVSFLLRFDLGPTLQAFAPQLLAASAVALFLKPLVFRVVGLYAIYWRYASSREVLRLLGAIAAASLALVVSAAFLARSGFFRGIPAAVLASDFFVTGVAIGSARLVIHLRLSKKGEASSPA
jgi:FlaA1/EpsC-like NDP-sugar epimerase